MSTYTFWMFIVFLVCLVFYLNSINMSNRHIETRNTALQFQYRLSWMTAVIVQQDSISKASIHNMFATLLGGPAAVLSHFVFNIIAKDFYERGIKVITQGYDKSDQTQAIYEQTFIKDACPYYKQVHDENIHGIEQEPCDQIYDGVLNKVSLSQFSKPFFDEVRDCW